jgi:hypothetical protein
MSIALSYHKKPAWETPIKPALSKASTDYRELPVAVAKLQFSTANIPGKCFGSFLADKTRDCCKTPMRFATGSPDLINVCSKSPKTCILGLILGSSWLDFTRLPAARDGAH